MRKIETKKLAAAVTALALCAGVLTGCGGAASGTASSTAASSASSEASSEEADEMAAKNVADLIDAIYVQQRTDDTDAQCEAAKAAWDALTDAQKELVEGENADPDYFGRDTGDASKDDARNADEIGENELLVVSFGTMSRFKPLSLLVRLYVYIMRSTPLMLQLAVVFYLPGIVFGPGHSLGRMGAAVLAFVLNYAAYFSEIFRGGIQGVPAGQREAGQVLGMTRSQIFFQVTLLQVVKRIVPPMGNEIITLVKDTSLSNFIMVGEIIKLAKDFGNKGMIWPLFYAGAFFLVFNGIVALALSRTEKKLDYFRV